MRRVWQLGFSDLGLGMRTEALARAVLGLRSVSESRQRLRRPCSRERAFKPKTPHPKTLNPQASNPTH